MAERMGGEPGDGEGLDEDVDPSVVVSGAPEEDEPIAAEIAIVLADFPPFEEYLLN